MQGRLTNDRHSKGAFYAALASAVWGFSPLYWNLLKQFSAIELLAQQIVWTAVLMTVLMLATRRFGSIQKVFSSRNSRILVFLCAVTMCVNRLVYILAVNSGHVVEASMGLFISPLISVLLGVLVLKEKVGKSFILVLALAFSGVLVLAFSYKAILWISLTIGISFASYGLFKKLVPAEPAVSTTLETFIMTPVSAAYLLLTPFFSKSATGAIYPSTVVLFFLSGVLTTVPLLLFAKGAKQAKLYVLGFMQYISPTIGLLLGFLVYHETASAIDFVGYGFIWAALLVFSLSNAVAGFHFREAKQNRLREHL